MSKYKLSIDLLPRGAWGHDLSKTLPKKDWDILRDFAYEKANYHCKICGKTDEQLHAHEIWDFDIPHKKQTLVDIVALCSACHGVKHFRNSKRIGYGQHAKAHFMRVNKCDAIVFAGHCMEAEKIFNERNKVLRWNMIVDLEKFGGNGIKYKQREIPWIDNPYAGIDFNNVKHILTDIGSSIRLLPDLNLDVKAIILQPSENANGEGHSIPKEAMYFYTRVADLYPPKLCCITVDNYSGTITVTADRVNKIQWISNDEVIKTKYNFAGKFVTKFDVENAECASLRFCLFGDGGKTVSQEFFIVKCEI